jgi:hypothetical protein
MWLAASQGKRQKGLSNSAFPPDRERRRERTRLWLWLPLISKWLRALSLSESAPCGLTLSEESRKVSICCILQILSSRLFKYPTSVQSRLYPLAELYLQLVPFSWQLKQA